MKRDIVENLQEKMTVYLEKEKELTGVFQKVEIFFQSIVLPLVADERPVRLQYEIRTEMSCIDNILFDIVECIKEIHRITSENNTILPQVTFEQLFEIIHQGIAFCEIAIDGMNKMLDTFDLYEEQLESVFGTTKVVAISKEKLHAFYGVCCEMKHFLGWSIEYIKNIEKLNTGLKQEKRFVKK